MSHYSRSHHHYPPYHHYHQINSSHTHTTGWISMNPVEYNEERAEEEDPSAVVSCHLWHAVNDPVDNQAPSFLTMHGSLTRQPSVSQAGSPLSLHHPITDQSPFTDLENDHITSSSLYSSDDDQKPAAAEESRVDTEGFRLNRHSDHQSINRDLFDGIGIRLFHGEDHDEMPSGDDVGVVENSKAKHDTRLNSSVRALTGQNYHNPQQSLERSTSTHHHSHLSNFHTLHTSLQQLPTTTTHAYHFHPSYGESGTTPVIPPPQIYRFGHSAPAFYGRVPAAAAAPSSSRSSVGTPPEEVHTAVHTPYPPQQLQVPSLCGGEDEEESPITTKRVPVASVKKNQTRKVVRIASTTEGGEASRRSLPMMRSNPIQKNTMMHETAMTRNHNNNNNNNSNTRDQATTTPAATTRSGERTSQVRLSPTDEEIADAKTPRARSALINWYARLSDLMEYRRQYGDCNVPQKWDPNPALGIWVNKQRMEKKFMDEDKKSSLTHAKLRALEETGFIWAKRKGQPSWDARFMELQAFRMEHGNCDVPTKYSQNPALGRWVSTQRSQFKQHQNGWKTQMTSDRVDLLNAIGFRWNHDRSESKDTQSSQSL